MPSPSFAPQGAHFIGVVATDPTTTELKGSGSYWFWFNSTTKLWKFFDGTGVIAFDSDEITPADSELTINGSVIVTGDIQVSGGGSYTYDEIFVGHTELQNNLTTGIIFTLHTPSAKTLTGETVGVDIDMKTNITVSNQIVEGIEINLPAAGTSPVTGLIITTPDEYTAGYAGQSVLIGVNDSDTSTYKGAFVVTQSETPYAGTVNFLVGWDGSLTMSGPLTLSGNVDIVLDPTGTTPVIELSADVFSTGTFIDIGYATAEDLTGVLTGIDIDFDTNVNTVSVATTIKGSYVVLPTTSVDSEIAIYYYGYDVGGGSFTYSTGDYANWTGLRVTPPSFTGNNIYFYGVFVDDGSLPSNCSHNWEALHVNTPSLTSSVATTKEIMVVGMETAGSLVQDTLAGVINWYGTKILTPAITQTTGTVTVIGEYLKMGTYTSGTAYFQKYITGSTTLFEFIQRSSTITHPTMRIYDNGGTDYIGFYNDDTLGHIHAHDGTNDQNIAFFVGDTVGDNADIRIYGWLEGVGTEFYSFGTYDDNATSAGIMFRIGVPAVTYSRAIHILEEGAVPVDVTAITVDNTWGAQPSLILWSAGATPVDCITIWSDTSLGHIVAHSGIYDQDIVFFTGDSAGDNANLQIKGYTAIAVAAAQTLYLGSDTITTGGEMYWRIGLPAAKANDTVHGLIIQRSNTALPDASGYEVEFKGTTYDHPILAIMDSGNTDGLFFWNDDTFAHIHAHDGTNDQNIQFFVGNTISDNADLIIAMWDNGAGATAYASIGSYYSADLDQAIFMIGVPQYNRNLVIGDYGETPTVIIDSELYDVANPRLIVASNAGTHAVAIFHNSTDGHIRTISAAEPTTRGNLIIQGQENQANRDSYLYDVEFFKYQADPGTDAMATGQVPEIRIYGWQHKTTTDIATVLRMASVMETINPTDDEYAYFLIGVDTTSSRNVVIADSDETAIEFTAASAHPTLKIFDAGGTDSLSFYDDGTNSHLDVTNPFNISPTTAGASVDFIFDVSVSGAATDYAFKIGADVFPLGSLFQIGFDTAETTTGVLKYINITNDSALTLGAACSVFYLDFTETTKIVPNVYDFRVFHTTCMPAYTVGTSTNVNSKWLYLEWGGDFALTGGNNTLTWTGIEMWSGTFTANSAGIKTLKHNFIYAYGTAIVNSDSAGGSTIWNGIILGTVDATASGTNATSINAVYVDDYSYDMIKNTAAGTLTYYAYRGTLPKFTTADAVAAIINAYGYSIPQSNVVTTGGATNQINWYGFHAVTPALTQTDGAITEYGIYLNMSAAITGTPTVNGIYLLEAGLSDGIGINLAKTTAYTGVDTEIGIDLKIAPAFTLTEPGAGIYIYRGAVIDISSIAVTAGAGTSRLDVLYLKAGADADAGNNCDIHFGNSFGKIDTNSKTSQLKPGGICSFLDARPAVSEWEVTGFNGVAAGAAGKGRLDAGTGTVSYFTMTGSTDETNFVTMVRDYPDLFVDTGTAGDLVLSISFDPNANGDKFDVAILDEDYVFVGTTTITASGDALQTATWSIGALGAGIAKGKAITLYITKCTDTARTGAANINFYQIELTHKVGIENDAS